MATDICILVSTRPDIIKMTPIVRALNESEANFTLLHSGQHYSDNMDTVFFEQLGLREPDHRIPTMKDSTHAQQTAHILEQAESYLLETNPSILLVYGDTNSALAGALAARKQGIPVGHVEAGLRSNDWRMPEEHNRVMIDHISELLFAPTTFSAENLREDGVRGRIEVTGNPVVDIVQSVADLLPAGAPNVTDCDLKTGEFVLVTCHREENVDQREPLRNIIKSLQRVAEKYDCEVIYPVHPRTQSRISKFGVDISGLTLIDPVGYTDFLHLERDAKLVLTDSGGVQEETCIIGTPCVTLRETTERQETVDVGANLVAGTATEDVLEAIERMMNTNNEWEQPFGESAVGERIIDQTLDYLNRPLEDNSLI